MIVRCLALKWRAQQGHAVFYAADVRRTRLMAEEIGHFFSKKIVARSDEGLSCQKMKVSRPRIYQAH